MAIDEAKMLAENASPNSHDELLTVAEVAELLKVPVSWVYERTRRRGVEWIPHFKLGKYLRFHACEVREWLHRLQEN
jgi:excisionase family DNA binding protein